MYILEIVSDYNGYGVSCNGVSDGSIGLTVSGGVPPYTYMWDDPSTQTASTAIGGAPGSIS